MEHFSLLNTETIIRRLYNMFPYTMVFGRFLYYINPNEINTIYIDSFYRNNFPLSLRLNQRVYLKNQSDERIKSNRQFAIDRINANTRPIFEFDIVSKTLFNDVSCNYLFHHTIKDYVIFTEHKKWIKFNEEIQISNKLCLELNTTYCNCEVIYFQYDFNGEYEIIKLESVEEGLLQKEETNGVMVTHEFLYRVSVQEDIVLSACLVRNKIDI